MRQQLSIYKYKKLSIEAFRNGLRLHFDSVLLYRNQSFPSAFQLSVLALEELAKSYWIEHYYYSSLTNDNFPDKDFQQKWLALLYFHPEKQKAFFGWGFGWDYNRKFMKFVEKGQLELKKQKATYVGLKKNRKVIDVHGRVSLPTEIKDKDAKKMISLLNDYLKDQCQRKFFYEFHYEIAEKDELLSKELYNKLKNWKHRSGLRTAPLFETLLKKKNR